MEFPTKSAIAGSIRGFLEERNWRYTDYKEEDVLLWEFSVRGRLRSVSVLVQFYDTGYSVHLLLPIAADPENYEERREILDFCNRVNDSLREGNFEMDPDQGDLRFRYYVDCQDREVLPRTLIRKSIFLPMEAAERYGEGFAQVLLNGKTGEEAFCLCRKQQAEEKQQPEVEEPEPDFFENWDFAPLGDPEEAMPPEEEPEAPEDPEDERIRSILRQMDTLLEKWRKETPEE